jgi:hypothetical protein
MREKNSGKGETISIAEAAEEIGIGVPMLRMRIRQGLIPVTRDRRIRRKDIEGQGRVRALSERK